MGIIILPFLIGAFVIVILVIKQCLSVFKTGSIVKIEVVFGFLLSLVYLAIVLMDYYDETEVNGLAHLFSIPIVMIISPFIIYKVCLKIKNRFFKPITRTVLFSILFSTVLALLFSAFFDEFLKLLEIRKFY